MGVKRKLPCRDWNVGRSVCNRQLHWPHIVAVTDYSSRVSFWLISLLQQQFRITFSHYYIFMLIYLITAAQIYVDISHHYNSVYVDLSHYCSSDICWHISPLQLSLCWLISLLQLRYMLTYLTTTTQFILTYLVNTAQFYVDLSQYYIAVPFWLYLLTLSVCQSEIALLQLFTALNYVYSHTALRAYKPKEWSVSTTVAPAAFGDTLNHCHALHISHSIP